jgi:5-methyltetrahydrofolate--homocysteine methyltransferase
MKGEYPVETRLSSATKEVLISDEQPTVIIGERINPTGKKKLTTALQAGDLEIVRQEAIAQVQAGADILDINVSADGVDAVTLLPRAVEVIQKTVNVPLCLDSDSPTALEAAIKVYQGKPLVGSVTGQNDSLKKILPLVREYGTAVIGLTIDDEGIPDDLERRVAIAHKIVKEAETQGVPREDVIIDCLALTVGADHRAGLVTIEAMRKVKAELGVNLTLGVSNISFGLPERSLLTGTFLAIAIAAGLNCAIVDAVQVRQIILAADLVLGHDRFAMRYIKAYRQRQEQ